MAVFILSFLVLTTIVVAMSVGVLMGKKPIKGSCGGMSALNMGAACDVCGGNQSICDDEKQKMDNSQDQPQRLAYNADGARKTDINP